MPSPPIRKPFSLRMLLGLLWLATVCAYGQPPTTTTLDATSVGDLTAVVSASVSSGSISAFNYFQIGTTTSYGSTWLADGVYTIGNATTTVTFSSLLPNTTYHYRAGMDPAGMSSVFGEDKTFTTGPPATPPGVSGVGFFWTHATGTHLEGSVSGGSSNATVTVEYGTTTTYGSQVSGGTVSMNGYNPDNINTQIDGLLPSTLYHVRFKATNSEGTTFGPDATFTTLDAPTVTTGAATGVTDITATLNGTFDLKGGEFFVSAQFGTTTAYGQTSGGTYTQGTGVQPASLHPAGLLPSTTYHYRLRLVDNFDGSDVYYGQDATFTTAPAATPPTPGGVSVELDPFTPSQVWLRLWSLQSGSSAATVSFEYGTTTAYGTTVGNWSYAANTADTIGIQYLTSGFQSGTTYHLRVKAVNAQGTTYSPDLTFTTGTGVQLVTGAAAGVTDLQATLNGTVNTNSYNANIFFDYGPTTSYGQTAPSSTFFTSSTPTPVSVTPVDLLPGTTYHYRLRAVYYYDTNAAEYGADMTFTTGAAATPPTVGSVNAPTIGLSTAVVNCYPVSSGSSPATVVFDYGTTTAYGNSVTASDALPTNVTGQAPEVSLSGLTSLTTYHVRCRVTNAEGTATSADATFTTVGVATVDTNAATNVGDLSATLNGVFNANGPSTTANPSFELGTTTAYGTTITATPDTILSASSVPFTGAAIGLLPNTTYHYRAKITQNFFDTVLNYFGPDVAFTTSAPATPPTVAVVSTVQITPASASVTTSAVSAGSSTAAIIWEYGTTTTYDHVAASSPAAMQLGTVGPASGTLTGLTPSTVYHFRCTATNNEGVAHSADATFTTPAAPFLTTTAASTITDLTATLNGTINPNGVTYYVGFDLGTDTNYGSTTAYALAVGLTTVPIAVNTNTIALQPNTTYHYRIKAVVNPVSGVPVFYGDDLTFTTAPPATPPSLIGLIATPLSPTAVTFRVIVNTGSSDATLTFDYGADTSYGTTVNYAGALPANTSNGASLPVMGLTPGTTYHFRARATNNEGGATTPDTTFTTTALPDITTSAASNITTVSATLNGSYAGHGVSYTAVFDYGPTTDYGSTATQNQGGGVIIIGGGGLIIGGGGQIIIGGGNQFTPLSANLTGLQPGTTLHYRVKLTDSGGNTYYGGDQSFTTLTAAALAQNWREQHFSSPDNSGPGSDMASPAGDGIPNLMKYALGLDPNASSTDAMPQPVLKDYDGVTYLSYSFQRDSSKTDLIYEVQAADSPAGPWTTIASSIGGAETTGAGFVSESPYLVFLGYTPLCWVEVHDTVSVTDAPRRFLRLQVSR